VQRELGRKRLAASLRGLTGRAPRGTSDADWLRMSQKSPSPQDSTVADPKKAGPKPDYDQQPIDPPGLESEMTPEADHGEQSYRGLGRLEGRVALITGGDSGIGRATAIAFAREGADLLISYLPEEQSDADETCRWVEDAGRRVVQLPGDITDERQCRP
jgi:hypothetical protein